MIEIKFNNSLYTTEAVKKAIKDYKMLADFCFHEKKNYFLVTISNIKEKELQPLFRWEFSNYVLSLVGALK